MYCWHITAIFRIEIMVISLIKTGVLLQRFFELRLHPVVRAYPSALQPG